MAVIKKWSRRTLLGKLTNKMFTNFLPVYLHLCIFRYPELEVAISYLHEDDTLEMVSEADSSNKEEPPEEETESDGDE